VLTQRRHSVVDSADPPKPDSAQPRGAKTWAELLARVFGLDSKFHLRQRTFLALNVLISIGSLSVSAAPVGTKIYSDQTYGYEFTYPDDLAVSAQPGFVTVSRVQKFHCPEGTSCISSANSPILVIRISPSEGRRLEDLYKVEPEVQNEKVLLRKAERTKLAGNIAERVVLCEGKKAHRRMCEVDLPPTYYVLRNGSSFAIDTTNDASATSILKSIKFKS